MKPLDENALFAEAMGRTLLRIHSGTLGKKGELRKTHGCLRVSDADMKSLLDILTFTRLQARDQIAGCITSQTPDIEVRITVTE